MPDDRQTMRDWLSAQQRLTSGRVSDPSQDAIGPASVPGWWWQEQAYRQRQTPGLIPRPQDAEALPLGSLSDPVSQAAFLLAPGVLRGAKASADLLGQPGYARQFGQGGPLKMLSGQRGNVGPPPVSEYGEALPRSVVRGADGTLTKLYHGTDRAYPDFDLAQSGSGEGGDLYGPGIYLTESPQVASGYAKSRLPDAASNVRPVYADLKRPFDIDAASVTPADLASLKPHAERYGINRRQWQELTLEDPRFPDYTPSGSYVYQRLADLMGKADTNHLLQDAGYDGITHIGGGNTGTAPHQVYIAFSPEHVYPAPAVEALRPAPGGP
jgi:hypothetical protein